MQRHLLTPADHGGSSPVRKPRRWQEAGAWQALASSLSGQARAPAACQEAPPGVWVWCEAREGGGPRHPLESFPTGRGYESTPWDQVQTATPPGPHGPAQPSAFCLPSTAQPDQTRKSHVPAPVTLHRLPQA